MEVAKSVWKSLELAPKVLAEIRSSGILEVSPKELL
jgi:hypothetical protein